MNSMRLRNLKGSKYYFKMPIWKGVKLLLKF